jgi:hypothetical protein
MCEQWKRYGLFHFCYASIGDIQGIPMCPSMICSTRLYNHIGRAVLPMVTVETVCVWKGVNSSNYFGVAADNMLTEEQNEIVESAAEMLYGLIHVRYILTSKGLSAMVCLITAVCMLISFQ